MTQRTRMKATSLVYQLKVTLKGSRPPIWRRFQIASDASLAELHGTLQTVMGWGDSHLHQFRQGRERFGIPDPHDPFGYDLTDERIVRLFALFPTPKAKLHYEYDFGDSWEHELILEKILPPEPSIELPLCLAGKRACPPEDCGGIWGYEELLEALSDPKHPEHKGRVEWLGEAFDPEAFEPEVVNVSLRERR